MITRRDILIQTLTLLLVLAALESLAYATGMDGEGSLKRNILIILSGKFGMFCLVGCALGGVACFLASGGQSAQRSEFTMYGILLLLAAAVLFAIRLLVATGTLDIIEQRYTA